MDKATLFVDESGKSSLADLKDNPFLLTGVILDNSELQTIEGFFNYIKLKFKLPTDKPFHSYEIYEKPSTKLSNSSLIELSKNISEFLSLIPIKVYVAEVNKSEFRGVLGIKSIDQLKGSSERKEMKEYPYRVTATYIFSMFGKYLIDRNSVGQVVADSRKGGDHQLLKTLNLCKENALPVKKEYYEAIKHYISAICFAEKSFLSGGLEITDLISFTCFNRAIRNISNLSDTGLEIIWKTIHNLASFGEMNKDGLRKFYGLKKGEVYKYLKTS